ncbi:MAG: hypothetical protein JNM83_17340 [Myxococcales bacterium]|nr:hypothetical protein [Myxococcales bacterium]
MRTCVSCGDPMPDKKRKDAKYCDKASCRGREYRKRQAEAQASESKPHTHAASTVLACACGRRYKIQICALDESESRPEPTPLTTPPEAITGTVLPTDQQPAEPDAGPEVQAADSEAVTQSVLLTDLEPQTADTGPALRADAAAAVTPAVLLTDRPADDPPPSPQHTAMDDTQALTQTDRNEAGASGFTTLQLYFIQGEHRRQSLNRAVYRRRDGRWTLQPQTRAAFCVGEENRPSLGGRPGAWERFYEGRSPIEFGYEGDLVVMSWDQKDRRGRVVQTSLLRDILGDDWKAKLRAEFGRK